MLIRKGLSRISYLLIGLNLLLEKLDFFKINFGINTGNNGADDLLLTALSWLKLNKIDISKEDFTSALKSHSDYPSLYSLTNTLEFFNIENSALKIHLEQIKSIKTPFLCYLRGRNNTLKIVCALKVDSLNSVEVIYNGKKKIIDWQEFADQWTGIVLIAEDSFDSKQSKKISKGVSSAYFGLPMILIFIFFINTKPAEYIVSGIINIILLIIGWSIFLHNRGISNSISHLFCGSGSNCSKPGDGKELIDFNGIKTLDFVGIFLIVKFLVWWTLGFTENTTNENTSYLIWFNLIPLPFTFYSLYVQLDHKKWCGLCLSLIVVFWVEFVYNTLRNPILNFGIPTIESSALLFFIISISSVLWFLLKSWISAKEQSIAKDIKYEKLKRNLNIFTSLYNQQSFYDFRSGKHDVTLGNLNSPIKLFVASNVFCKPCSRVHKVLEKLLEKYPDKLSVTFKFSVDANQNSENERVVSHILKLKNENEQWGEIISSWYKKMNFREFILKYPTKSDCDVKSELAEHSNWFREHRIKQTPTLFLNGRILPEPYSIDDLELLVIDLFDYFNDQVVSYEAG